MIHRPQKLREMSNNREVKTYPKGRGRPYKVYGAPVIRIKRNVYHGGNDKDIYNVVIYFYFEACEFTNINNERTIELFEHGDGFAFRLYPDRIKSKGYKIYKVGSCVQVYAPAIWGEEALPDGLYEIAKSAEFYTLKPFKS